jgi:2-C-methyl-D-erythritol 4-phosphate cytidylyltransferase
VDFLNEHFHLKPNDILITHDAARININNEIINQNIAVATKYGYASTVLPLRDSIGQLTNTIQYINRSHKYIIQTPQTIQYKF